MKTIFLLLIPFFSFGQKKYHYTGMFTNIPGYGAISPNKIFKISGDIVIDDSTFSISTKGQNQKYQIVKKVSDTYFKISDGLQELIVNISTVKNGKYTGSISLKSDDTTVIYFLKE